VASVVWETRTTIAEATPFTAPKRAGATVGEAGHRQPHRADVAERRPHPFGELGDEQRDPVERRVETVLGRQREPLCRGDAPGGVGQEHLHRAMPDVHADGEVGGSGKRDGLGATAGADGGRGLHDARRLQALDQVRDRGRRKTGRSSDLDLRDLTIDPHGLDDAGAVSLAQRRLRPTRPEGFHHALTLPSGALALRSLQEFNDSTPSRHPRTRVTRGDRTPGRERRRSPRGKISI
jgi:hypothetical protein